MTIRKKVTKVKKSIRLSKDMIELVQKKSNKSGKPFSVVIRRAIFKHVAKPTRTKAK